jgi:TIR domain
MTPAERIAAIKESATLLSQQSWYDIDLILSQYGMRTGREWPSDDRYGYVVNVIQSASDDGLYELHQYLIGDSGDVLTGPQPWGQGQLKLFMSHLARKQQFVGRIGEYLSSYGISCFVAHVSIEPSEEWLSVIEVALRSCDAAAVFLHTGFHKSNWCDQEVGFALARRVPVLPIAIDEMPYGFMGKLQAVRCLPNESSSEVAQKVLQWLERVPAAKIAMTEGLVTVFEQSSSYNETRRLYRLLVDTPTFTSAQLQRLEAAIKENHQVRDAVLGSNAIPDLIRKLILDRGGTLTGVTFGNDLF